MLEVYKKHVHGYKVFSRTKWYLLDILMQRRCEARRKYFLFLFFLYFNDIEKFLQENNNVGIQSISYEIQNDLSIHLKLLIFHLTILS